MYRNIEKYSTLHHQILVIIEFFSLKITFTFSFTLWKSCFNQSQKKCMGAYKICIQWPEKEMNQCTKIQYMPKKAYVHRWTQLTEQIRWIQIKISGGRLTEKKGQKSSFYRWKVLTREHQLIKFGFPMHENDTSSKNFVALPETRKTIRNK
jgi:hypothetical protein